MVIHRIATSDIYKDDLLTVQRDWSMDDVLDATLMLDAIDDAREQQRKESERAR